MNFKKFVRSAACTALCAAGALTMSGCNNYGKMIREQPEEYIEMAAENTAGAIFKSRISDEYSPIFNEALKDGTFTLDFEAEGIKFSGECSVNEKPGAVSQSCTLTGSKGTSAQIYVYADESGMKFGTVGQSGSHIYDVNFSTLAEKLAASIFAPDSDSSYALDQGSYDSLLGSLGEIDSAAAENEEIANKYQEIIDSYFANHKPITEEKIDADIGGETVKSNVFTYNIPCEDVKSLANQFIDIAAEEMGESSEDMKDRLQELLDSIEDCEVTLTYYINSKTNVLMKSDFTFDVTADGESGEIYINAFYGADPENSEKQSFRLGMRDDTEDNYFLADIVSGENRSEVSVTMYDDGEETKLLTLTSERSGDFYTITADLPDTKYSASIEGTVTADKNSFDLTVDKISAADGAAEFSYSPKAAVNVRKGGELLKLDAEKEFLDITEIEMDELIEIIHADFSAVFEELANDGSANADIE